MPFIRRKTVRNKNSGTSYSYKQLVRNYRKDGKHRQEVLCHLGAHDSLEAAVQAERERASALQKAATEGQRRAESHKRDIMWSYAEVIGEVFPSHREAALRYNKLSVEYERHYPYPSEEWWEEWELVHELLDYHRTKNDALVNEARARRSRMKVHRMDRLQKHYGV